MGAPKCGIHATYRSVTYSVFRGCTRPESHPGACRDGDHELTPTYLEDLYKVATAPTRADFLAYVRVQAKGDLNMYDEAAKAATGLLLPTYERVQLDYHILAEAYPDVASLMFT